MLSLHISILYYLCYSCIKVLIHGVDTIKTLLSTYQGCLGKNSAAQKRNENMVFNPENERSTSERTPSSGHNWMVLKECTWKSSSAGENRPTWPTFQCTLIFPLETWKKEKKNGLATFSGMRPTYRRSQYTETRKNMNLPYSILG